MRPDLDKINKEIESISALLSRTPDDHPNLRLMLVNLGQAYLKRYALLADPGNIHKTIDYTTIVLVMTPDEDPTFPPLLDILGSVHNQRLRDVGDMGDLEKSIEYTSLAAFVTPDGDPDLPPRLAIVRVAHRERFKRLSELDDIEKAIECDTRAVSLTPDGNPELPGRLADLGATHRERFERLGQLDDIEKAIEYDTRAVSLTPSDHPDMTTRLEALAVSHSHRFDHLAEINDVDKAVECHSRALALASGDDLRLSSILGNIGASYTTRFRHLGELNDVAKAIDSISCALALTPDEQPSHLMNLGTTHSYRFDRLRELNDLEKAIEYHSRGVASISNDHPQLPSMLSNLGGSYNDRYLKLRELGDLEKSIECHSRALALTPDEHPYLVQQLCNLGNDYYYRFQHLGEIGNLEKAIECVSCALAVIDHTHSGFCQLHFNHAQYYFWYYQRSNNPSHLQDALHSYRISSSSPAGAPRKRFDTARVWAKHASIYSSLNLIEAYQTAINLLPQFIWLGATTDQRYQDLLTAGTLAVDATSAAISCLSYDLALEWIEHARCVVWNQSLMLRSPLDKLQFSHPNLAARLQTVANQLHSAGSESQETRALSVDLFTGEQVAQKHRGLAQEYDHLLSEIRTLSGFEELLQPMKVDRLTYAARYGPIVVIVCHEKGCDALIVSPEHKNVSHLALPLFNWETGRTTGADIETSLRHKRLRERGVKRREDPDHKDMLEGVLLYLWIAIVEPVLDFLGYLNDSSDPLPHITWCPTGPVSFLPLHAAGDYSQPRSRVFDYVVSSYTPTLTALLSCTASTLTHESRVLGIGLEVTPEHNPLPGTADELASVRLHTSDKVRYSQLMNKQATAAAVLDEMQEHDWVHLACHAHRNFKDSTKSGFFLSDGVLDIAAINKRSFKKKGLAFLSACQTATGDEKLPDEAVHLASGMLMAGYSSVIATMWSVVDDDAPFVADKVYAELMKEGKVGNGEAGRALHGAVAGLRERVGEKEFGRWVPYIHIGS